ncbi:hypothetical protein [Corynebacterium argentoratense]|uniref:hypothetical protein n=1 Tax=Corynebacterium argentoratense TaxID=42817 RepID=UPI001F41EC8C|nr:hypothetical protein [Corynebacterium argentoratense]MCF1765804.1 hypothetical protein [Corynebacterium argentoratense]
MDIHLDLRSIDSVITTITQAYRTPTPPPGLNSYTGLSGLSDLAQLHSAALTSAHGAQEQLGERVTWLAQALGASIEALSGQNLLNAHGLDLDSLPGPNQSVVFPPKPAIHPAHTAFHTPTCSGGGGTIAGIRILIATSRRELAQQASEHWTRTQQQCAEAASQLDKAAQELAGSNHGDVITQACESLAETIQIAQHLSDNAGAMSAWSRKLNDALDEADAVLSGYEEDIAKIAAQEGTGGDNAAAAAAAAQAAENEAVDKFYTVDLPAILADVTPPKGDMLGVIDGLGQARSGANNLELYSLGGIGGLHSHAAATHAAAAPTPEHLRVQAASTPTPPSGLSGAGRTMAMSAAGLIAGGVGSVRGGATSRSRTTANPTVLEQLRATGTISTPHNPQNTANASKAASAAAAPLVAGISGVRGVAQRKRD